MEGGKSRGKCFSDQLEALERVSRVQRQALWESRIYELELPLEIQNRIVEIENNLWQELDRQNLCEECNKAEEWILDPSHTFGHVI